MVSKTHILSRATVLGIAALLTASLAGCGPADDMRGNNPDKKVMASIKPGVTDKASVTKLLGSPSSVASFDNNTWYYISQETQNVAFFKPRLKDQKVVSIVFNDKGIVKQVGYIGMDQHVEVVPNPDATPAPGREFTLMEQLIGNFGRFSSEPPNGGASGSAGH